MIRQVSFYLFYDFADALNTLHRLSDPTRREAHACGRHWLPKREGAHEVGRPSRGHLPRSVSRRMIGPEKEVAHAVGRTSRRHVPHGVPQRMIGPEKEGSHAVGRPSRGHLPRSVSRRPSLTCRKRLSPPRGTCSHTQCQAPDSSPRTTRSTH